MFDAIFGRSVKILKLLAKVQCVLAFVLASMLCGAVHEMLKLSLIHISEPTRP